MPADYHGSLTDYAALKAAGAPVLGWGQFLTVVINFLILAFIIFLHRPLGEPDDAKEPEEAPGGPEPSRSLPPPRSSDELLEALGLLRPSAEPRLGAERVAVHQVSVAHHLIDVAEVADPLGGIAVDEHQVSLLADRD